MSKKTYWFGAIPNRNLMALILTVAITTLGCAKENDKNQSSSAITPTNNSLSIAGQYTDNYSGGHIIGANSWVMTGWGTSVFHFEEVNDSSGFIIAQNDASNPYDANLYSRFDYQKQSDGRVLFCQTAYNAASKQVAESATPANFLTTSGCGGFPFSVLTPSAVVKAKQKPKGSERELASTRNENDIPRRGKDSIKNKMYK